MAIEELPYRFRIRGGTAADLSTVNEVPLRRELCIELDTGKMKLGDGTTPWNDLPYISGGGGDAPVEFQSSATHIQWRLVGDPDWIDLVALADLKGEDGDDGREVELQKSATHIQWRYVGDPTWADLVALDDISGDPGEDGREVELQKNATHIQWRYVGDVSWLNLVALADITGPAGAPAVGAAVRDVVTINSGSGSVTIAKVALLIRLVTTAAARCRFYSTAAARDADAARAANVPAPQGSGLMLEFISTGALLGAPLTPGVIAYNLDSPVTAAVYYNIQPVGGAMTVDLTFLALEN